MKNIIEFLQESAGMDPFLRDGSHGKGYDDLLPNNTKSKRNMKLAAIKEKNVAKYVLNIFTKSKWEKTFNKSYQFFYDLSYRASNDRQELEHYATNLEHTMNVQDPFGVILSYDITHYNSSVKNMIANYFNHDKITKQFYQSSDKDYEANKLPFSVIVTPEYIKFIFNYNNCSDFNKFLKDKNNDIIYTINKICDLYTKLKSVDNDGIEIFNKY